MSPAPYIHANNRKTHCSRGHALTLDNCLPGELRLRGQRRCRRCKREMEAARRRNQKAQLAAAPKPEPKPFMVPMPPGSLSRDELAIEREAFKARHAIKFAAALERSKALEALHEALKSKGGRPRKGRPPHDGENEREEAA